MIGNVPTNWKVENISDIVFFQEGPGVRKTQFTENGVKLLNVGNINDNKIDLSSTKVYISEKEAFGKYKHFLVEDGDLLIACSGIVVKTFHKKIAFITKKDLPLCLNTSTMRFRTLDAKNLSINFFQYFLMTNIFRKQLQKLITGSAQLNFGPSHIKKMFIPLPPLPQQEKIVKVLDISSALVEKQSELIKKYDMFLKSKFIEMFGDPISNPKGWEVEKLGNSIIDVKNGLTRRGTKNSGDIVLKLKDIRTNYVNFINLNRIDLDEKEKEKFIAEKEDLLFIRVNGNPEYVGRCAVFHGYIEPVYFNDHIMRIKLNTEKYNSVFLGYIVNSQYGKKQILKYRKTSAGQHTISQDGLERLSFYLPPITLQNKFAQIVEKIEQIKEKENKKLTHLQTLHNSLMDRAFKGEIK